VQTFITRFDQQKKSNYYYLCVWLPTMRYTIYYTTVHVCVCMMCAWCVWYLLSKTNIRIYLWSFLLLLTNCQLTGTHQSPHYCNVVMYYSLPLPLTLPTHSTHLPTYSPTHLPTYLPTLCGFIHPFLFSLLSFFLCFLVTLFLTHLTLLTL
jgi:hypothetical protein